MQTLEERKATQRKYRETHVEKCREMGRTYRETHREQYLETKRKYREAHREQLCALARKEYKEHPERAKIRKLKYKYGVLDGGKQLLAERGEVCQLCGKEENPLSIDHNHITGVVRGLLCKTCNVGLGMFHDDPALLRKAADYCNGGKGDNENG